MEIDKIVGSRQRVEAGLPGIHESVDPADIRATDRVLGRVRKRASGHEYTDVRVWKLSPLGVEFLDEQGVLDLHKGDAIDLLIVITGQRTVFEGLVVDVVQEQGGRELVGVRLSTSKAAAARLAEEERRQNPRWICSQDFYPTCIALSPGRYNDYIYFQIRDISANGFRLSCSLRNKFLLKGMILKLMISLPLVGEASATVRIARIGISSAGGRDFLVVGTEFVNLSENTRNSIAQYLIQFSSVEDLDSLRQQGFLPQSVANGVDFYFLKSEEDYRQVLELRLLAHKLEGNLANEEAKPEDLADIRDASGRILVGKYKGQVVATGRILFPDQDTPLEQEDYIEWPQALPRREQIVELGRVCTDPNFRKGDLFARVLQQVTATCVRIERPYVVVVALPHLLKLYKRLGCVETGIVHRQEFWNGEQHVLIVNGFDVCMGKGVSPFVWNYVYREPFEYLLENGFVQVSGLDRARIQIFRSLGWLTDLLVFFQKLAKRR